MKKAMISIVSLVLLATLYTTTSVTAFSNKPYHSLRPTTTLHAWTLSDIEDYADQQGVVLSFTTLGPGYRAVARAKQDESLVLGYVEGFLRPAGNILHLDKMEAFQPQLKKARKLDADGFDFGGISFGVGLLMGYRCLLHGA